MEGVAPQVLDSLDEENLLSVIKLQTVLGQAIGSTYHRDKKDSAQAFEDALAVSSQMNAV